jgi:hypothetical protein
MLPADSASTASVRISPERAALVRTALPRLLPRDGDGITWATLCAGIAPLLPASLFPQPGVVHWYVKAVRLDLETRGVIERVPGVPVRFRQR